MSYPSFAQLCKHPTQMLAFGFGSGLLRPASGTWGSLCGLLLLLPFYAHFNWLSAGLFLLITFALGCYVCDISSKALGQHDHSGIVWDEFVGIWTSLLFAPKALWQALPDYGVIALIFALFRLFDITKPSPIRYLDKHSKGGFGIMIDDLFAGFYALASLYAIAYLLALA